MRRNDPGRLRARVIKVGGRPQADPALVAALTGAWANAPGAVVVVHGGGDAVSALQRAFGVEPVFVAGRRVTDAADVERLRMALSGSANKRLVASLVSTGAKAIGISGEDGGLIGARVVDPEMGRVGAPATINAELLEFLLSGGYLPVISPMSRDLDSNGAEAALNVNGDDAAAAIAIAAEASELLLVSDVDGVLVNGSTIDRLTPEGVRELIADGTAAGGMAAKLDAAVAALDGGVPRVRIGNLAAIADLDRGTVVSRADQPAWSA